MISWPLICAKSTHSDLSDVSVVVKEVLIPLDVGVFWIDQTLVRFDDDVATDVDHVHRGGVQRLLVKAGGPEDGLFKIGFHCKALVVQKGKVDSPEEGLVQGW